MAFPATYRTITRLRLLLSILLSATIHAVVLLLMEIFGVFTPQEVPTDFEPLVVQIGFVGELDLRDEEPETPPPQQAQNPPVKPAPPQAPPPEPKPAVKESKPAPKPPSQPAERIAEPKEAASPWSALAQDADPVLAGDPYGDLPTKETGGLRVAGDETVDTSLPGEVTPTQTPSRNFFDEIEEVDENIQPVVAESRPVHGSADSDGAIEGELLDALDSRLAESGSPTTRPEAIIVSPRREDREEGDSLVEWQDKGKGRKLLLAVPPDLSRIKNLDTPVLRIYAEIEVQAGGRVSKVSILELSGVTEVDAAVRAALSLWQFEQVSNEEGSIKGRIRYTITAVINER